MKFQFVRYAPERDAFEVNVAAGRLALGILPGLQPSVLHDSSQVLYYYPYFIYY